VCVCVCFLFHYDTFQSGNSRLEDSAMSTDDQSWNDIDKAESQDHLFSAEYAPEIFQYMREREVILHLITI